MTLGACAALVLATACATEPEATNNGTITQPEATANGETTPPDAADPLVTGLYDFAERFGQSVLTEGENSVYSPLSIAYAFAMLRAGADGETASQLDDVFGFPADGLAEAARTLAQQTVTIDDAPPRTEPGEARGPDDEPQDPIVAIANGLFVQDGLTLEPEFTETLAEYYGARPIDVDFASPEAIQTIDEWVDEQTAGRIDRLFDELDPETVAVLANAIYMKAEWEHQFTETATEDSEFTLGDGSTVTVPMMSKDSLSLRYLTGGGDAEGWSAIELPYAGGELSMWLVLADPSGETGTPAAPNLSASLLEQLHQGGETVSVDVALPRWDFGTTIELLGQLRELGLTDLTDLDGITPQFAVNDAIHRANITVDEQGTEAAAVTGVAGVTSLPPDAEIQFRADRPFSFVVMHTPTGAPLFAGAVENPLQ